MAVHPVNKLELAGVAIDTCHALYPTETTFLLTHLHSDHIHIPKQFAHTILASTYVQQILPTNHAYANIIHPCLLPWQTYWTKRKHRYIVVPVEHSPESIGFLFPELRVLYIGDGSLSDVTCDQLASKYAPWPLYIFHDMLLYNESNSQLPNRVVSETLLRSAVQLYCGAVRLVHHGMLSLFNGQRSPPLRFRIHGSLSTLCRNTARWMGLEDPDSPLLLVGENYDKPHITLSVLWFVYHHRDGYMVQSDGNGHWRVCYNHHATRDDIARILVRWPGSMLVPIETTALRRSSMVRA